MPDEIKDELAVASDTPDINFLQEEYKRSIDGVSEFTDTDGSDEIRFCRWDSQSEDGKKWQANIYNKTQVFPFDGASDTRIPLADQIASDISDVLVTSFSRAILKVNGVEVSDTREADTGG